MVGETQMIFDPVRRRYVALTPEEWVRQHFVQYLVRQRGTPQGLIAVESGFTYNGMWRRADVIVHGRDGKPVLMAECKAPEVQIVQAAFDQISRYNTVVQARFLVVTNGLTHYCCEVHPQARATRFLDEVPLFDALEAPG
jgi:hypothetical protein